MLRTYKPIQHPIFTLHKYLEHLVCQVWCNACNTPCQDLLLPDFKVIYDTYDWLNNSIDTIYEKCKTLTKEERERIRGAFSTNNRIKDLCDGILSPIPLRDLPVVVKNDMKPLLIRFYGELLDRAVVPGGKLDYYNNLIEKNKYRTCPCCGLYPIQSPKSRYREDNDHHLPKNKYPFAAVNFMNLVPLCGMCNEKCKKAKNPFERGRVSFYPFDYTRPDIEVYITIANRESLDYNALKANDIELTFSNDINKINTWDWLFEIKNRYNEEVRGFSKTELRIIANRRYRNKERNTDCPYEEILNDVIGEYQIDQYEDRKFLKISFLNEMKNKPEWIAVYT